MKIKLWPNHQGYIQTNILELDKKSYFSNSKANNIPSRFPSFLLLANLQDYSINVHQR